MSMGSLSMVAESVGGRLMGPDREFDAVSTDTRTLQAGQLFFALRGERFNAAEFVEQAACKGAAGAVVEQPAAASISQVEVNDTRLALGDLARSWRKKFDLPVVAVTGSNGKTTVKEMIAAILAAREGQADAVLATRGNYNNDIGLPLTVLKLRANQAFAIFELGANAPGEIGYLANIAAAEIALVNNAGPAHLEGFGDVAGVARAKGELFSALRLGGIAVINRDDDYYDYWRGLCAGRQVFTFGMSDEADYQASDIQSLADPNCAGVSFSLRSPQGRFPIRLAMAGEHNVRNALAAIAASVAAGADMADVSRGLSSVSNVTGRLRSVATSSGAVLYDDTYNANPASVHAALQFLVAQAGETWFVFGDMGELGANAAALHADVGEQARRLGVDHFLCVGPQSKAAARSFGTAAEHYSDYQLLAAAVEARLQSGQVWLVKASRYMGLEKLVRRLAAVPSS